MIYVVPMEKYQRCLICGNYFVTEKGESSDEENCSDLEICPDKFPICPEKISNEICPECNFKEYLCCAVLGEYIPVVSNNKSVCAGCKSGYFESVATDGRL